MTAETLLGVDVGTRRIGLAKGDVEVKIASPLAPIASDANSLTKLVDLIRATDAQAVVIGLPRNASGQETSQSAYSRGFAAELRSALAKTSSSATTVVLQDESLTSVAAEDVLRRDKRHYDDRMLRDGTLDSQAAVIILTDYLEGLK